MRQSRGCGRDYWCAFDRSFWAVLAAISQNILRAVGALASLFHTRARDVTLRRDLISVPASTARTGRHDLTRHGLTRPNPVTPRRPARRDHPALNPQHLDHGRAVQGWAAGATTPGFAWKTPRAEIGPGTLPRQWSVDPG
ncbi:MAG: hypothetical protein WAK28_29265 [Trebonia sp.]